MGEFQKRSSKTHQSILIKPLEALKLTEKLGRTTVFSNMERNSRAGNNVSRDGNNTSRDRNSNVNFNANINYKTTVSIDTSRI